MCGAAVERQVFLRVAPRGARVWGMKQGMRGEGLCVWVGGAERRPAASDGEDDANKHRCGVLGMVGYRGVKKFRAV